MLFRVVELPELAEKFEQFREDQAQELLRGLPIELEGRVEPLATSYGPRWEGANEGDRTTANDAQ